MAHRVKFLTLIFCSLAIGALGLTCSSSKTSTPGTSGSLTSCPKNDLEVIFAPMYSAHIDGDNTHTFQIPAVVQGISPSAITWSASDKTMVDLASDPTTKGIMITVQKSGTVSIIASAGTLCGSSTLTITSATTTDWENGNSRYNDGISLTGRLPGMGGPGGPGGGANADASVTQIACTTCHGDTATAGPYTTVSHTPEQTGGFSDEQLQGIFMNGTFPGGAKDPSFDPSIVTYATWQAFHKWDMTADEAKGIIVYLRSLTPQPQNGAPNFGGRFDGGVGMRDGGMGMRDGGGRGMGMGMGGMAAGGLGGTAAGGMGGMGAGGTGTPVTGTGGSSGTDNDAATD